MITSPTQTITTSTLPPIILNLRTRLKNKCPLPEIIRNTLIELGEILIKHENYKDFLSLNLQSIGAKILEDGSEPSLTIQVQLIREFAKNHFFNSAIFTDLLKLSEGQKTLSSQSMQAFVEKHFCESNEKIKADLKEILLLKEKSKVSLIRVFAKNHFFKLKMFNDLRNILLAEEPTQLNLIQTFSKKHFSKEFYAQTITDLQKLIVEEKTIQARRSQGLLQTHCSELDKILRNSLDQAPLNEPMLVDGNWIWEKNTLEYYIKSLSTLSPFTQKPFTIKPHEFAKDILTWKRSISFVRDDTNSLGGSETITLPNLEKTFITSSNAELTLKVQLTYFNQLALLRKNERVSRELADRAKALDIRTQELLPIIEKKIQEGTKKAQQYAIELEKALCSEIERYEKIHQETTEMLNSSLQDSNDRAEILNGKVEELVLRSEKQQQQIWEKSHEIEGLRSQLHQALNRINNDRGGGCTIL